MSKLENFEMIIKQKINIIYDGFKYMFTNSFDLCNPLEVKTRNLKI